MSESWDRKIDRAKQHLSDFLGLIGNVQQSDVYPTIKKWETHNHCDAYVWRVQLPALDGRLPILAADILFNIRSALDHVAVALVPENRKREASFPIFVEDIRVRKETGKYLHARSRRAWEKCITGMPEDAIAFLDSEQPYQVLSKGEDPHDTFLAILNDLHIADKHRQLVVVLSGVKDPVTHWRMDGGGGSEGGPGAPDFAPNLLLGHNAIVHRVTENPPPPMDVEIEGPLEITIGDAINGPMRVCPDIFAQLLWVAGRCIGTLSVIAA